MIGLAMLAAACHGRPDSGTQDRRLLATSDSPLPGLRKSNAVNVGDFDGDGRQDIAVLGGERELVVLIGQGQGRFARSSQGVIQVGDTATDLAIGDVNGDGLSDAAVSHHDDFQIVVLLGAPSVADTIP